MTIEEVNTLIQFYRPKKKQIIATALVCAFLVFAPESWLLFLLRSPHPYLPPWIGLLLIIIVGFQAVELILHIKARIKAWDNKLQSRLSDRNVFKRRPRV